jgi:D-alanyl-D-alanine dipeptidase
MDRGRKAGVPIASDGREPIAALERVRLEECGEPLVHLRQAVPGMYVARKTAIPWARERVAGMLAEAARSLPEGVVLGVIEAWRPLQRQKRGYDRYFNELRRKHPEWPLSTLKRMTNRFLHPYDRKVPPGHCTGGAVDVSLYRPDGTELDLVSPYERKWTGAPTHVKGLTPEARDNRRMLLESMLGAGFSVCLQEFWHYSFGDAPWAVRTGRDVCFYGWIDLPEEHWREAEAESIRIGR